MLMSEAYAQTPGEWTWMSGVSSGNYIGDFGIMGITDLIEKNDHVIQHKLNLRS